MKSKIHRFAPPSAALFIALVASPLAGAAPLTWDTTIAADATITDGAGTWTVGAGNWNNGATSVGVNFTTGDTVTFGSGAALAAAYMVTLGGTPTTVGSISANYTGGSSYTIGATANSQSIAFTGGTGSISVTGAPTNNLVFNAVVAGNFTVTGSGNKGAVLLGNGAQTAANTLTVSASTLLQAGSNSSTGSFGAATIVNNGVVNYRRSGTVTMSNAISGGGAVTYQLRAATVNLNTAGTYLGATSIGPTAVVAPPGTTASTVNWGVTNALPATTAFTFNPNTNSSITLDLKGFNQTVASLAGTGTVSDSIFTSTTGAPTLTVSGTTTTSYGGLLSGNLALTKGNTGQLTLNGVSTYTGNTAINGGTLALGASASISSTPRISIAAGGTFDVSLIPSYTLSASTSLSASGTATPANIKGGTTVDLGSQPITLTYDGTNPPLTVSQGALTLTGNAFTVNSATPLLTSSHTLIQQASGTITNSGSFTVAGTAMSGSTAALDFGTAGAVKLNLVEAPVDDTNSTISASPATLVADNTSLSTVTVTLKDAGNVALPGVGVKWSVSGTGNTVSVAEDYGTTNGSGVFTFTVKSVTAGTKTVTFTVGTHTFTTNINFTVPPVGYTLAWDPALTTTASDGAGPWNLTTANWANSGANIVWPNNGNDTAVFGTSGPLAANATVTLGAPITVSNLNFTNTSANSNQYTIAGAGLNILTLGGTVDVAANALISSPLAGSGFAKANTGTLRIDGNSPTYSGAVTVNAGLLQIGNNGAGGNLGTGTITLANAGTIVVRKGSGGSMTLNNTIDGSTTGAVGFQLNTSANPVTTVVTVAKANTYTAAGGTYLQPTAANTVGTLALGIADALPTTTVFSITLNGASLQTFDLAGFNQTLASLGGTGTATTAVITSSSGTPTLTVSGTATTVFNGLVSGSLAVSKGGSGSQTLSAANTYSGATTVTEGTLKLNNPNANNESSTVSIAASGATLELAFDETGGPVTDTVDKLFIGAVQQIAGVYKAIANVTDAGTPIAQITGPGTLTVTSGPGASTPYDDWATIKGLTAGNKAKNLDPDNDGRNNLGEFAFNGDPLSGSDNGKVFVLTEDSDAAGDPSNAKELILTAAVRSGTLVFTGSPSPSANQVADAITYTIEGSLDLGSFPTTVKVVPTPVVTGLPPAGADYEYRSFSLDGSNGLTGKGFLRAKVTSL